MVDDGSLIVEFRPDAKLKAAFYLMEMVRTGGCAIWSNNGRLVVVDRQLLWPYMVDGSDGR